VSNQEHIIVPTDKTNSFTVMQTDDYKQKVLKHLLRDGKEISRERLIQAKEPADKLLEEIDRLCSKGERDFIIQEPLKSKVILSPKLLVKDHKKKDKWGKYSTQPGQSYLPLTFNLGLSKTGLPGYQQIFDHKQSDYMKKTIVQASHAKHMLEKLHINKSRNTVFSLDIECFYPLVTYSLVEITINYFAMTSR
jgi:hypothetical protein